MIHWMFHKDFFLFGTCISAFPCDRAALSRTIPEFPSDCIAQCGMLAWSSADTPEEVKASWFNFSALSLARICYLKVWAIADGWCEAVGTVWLFCVCSFHIHSVGICDIPDLDVSMDPWSCFHACLVSIWLHRFYIYSAVAVGISLWIVIQFTTTRAKRKVTEPGSISLWADPKNLGGSE